MKKGIMGKIQGGKIVWLSIVILCMLLAVIFISIKPSEGAVNSPFYRYLAVGSVGTDVKLLQQLLNTDPQTQVSLSGAGAPGLETTYFGLRTKQALINFQRLHRNNLLYGYAGYTGAVDEETRVLLNEYAAKINFQGNGISLGSPLTAQDQLNTTYKAGITVIPGFPYIDYISSKSVTNGDYITIYGRYFSTSTPNIIRMTYNQVSAISSDGVTLRIQLNSVLNDMYRKKTKDLDEDEKNEVKKKFGEMPLFITVQNNKGVSNPYMIYFKLK